MNSKRNGTRKAQSPTLARYLNKKTIKTTNEYQITPKGFRGGMLTRKYASYGPMITKFSDRISLKESLTVKRIGISPMRYIPSNPVSTSFTLDPISTKSAKPSLGSTFSCQILTPEDESQIPNYSVYKPIIEESLLKRTFTPRKELNILKPLESSPAPIQRKAFKRKVPFKEAQQIKEWAIKAKPEIEKM